MAQMKDPKRDANSRQRQCQECPNNVDNWKRVDQDASRSNPEEENLKYQPRKVDTCTVADWAQNRCDADAVTVELAVEHGLHPITSLGLVQSLAYFNSGYASSA